MYWASCVKGALSVFVFVCWLVMGLVWLTDFCLVYVACYGFVLLICLPVRCWFYYVQAADFRC